MKTKEIKTDKATILVVDLPEEAYNMRSLGLPPYGIHYTIDIKSDTLVKRGCIIKTKFRVTHLGQLSDITEEQWKDVVYKSESFGLYENYCETVEFGVAIRFNTATESGLSLLKANGVLLDNPYGEKEPNFIDVEIATAGSAVSNDFDSKVKSLIAVREKWQQAQQQVWKNVHIFLKK